MKIYCYTCKYCVEDTICSLLDDLIIGYCFMHTEKE